jgi:hypothetical protein
MIGPAARFENDYVVMAIGPLPEDVGKPDVPVPRLVVANLATDEVLLQVVGEDQAKAMAAGVATSLTNGRTGQELAWFAPVSWLRDYLPKDTHETLGWIAGIAMSAALRFDGRTEQ